MTKGIRTYIREVLYLMWEPRKRIGWLLIIFLISSLLDFVGLGVVSSYLVFVLDPNIIVDGAFGQWLIEVGVKVSESQLLFLTSGLLVMVFLMKMIVSIYANWRILVYSRECRVSLQSKLMQAYQRQPYFEYIQRNTAEYVKNIHDATGQYVSVVQTMLRMVGEGLVALAIFSYLAYAHTLILVTLTILFGLFAYLYMRIFKNRSRQYGELTVKAVHQIVKSISEGLNGFKELRILGKENYFHNALITGARAMSSNWAKGSIIAMIPRFFLEFILIGLIVSFVLMTLLSGGRLESVLPTIGVFAIAALRLLPTASLFIGGASKLSFNRHPVSILYNDLIHVEKYLKSDVRNFSKTSESGIKFEQLSLEQVSYRYPEATNWAIKDLSLSIRAGESIGVIGESGSGKTTLIDLMLGLLEPQAGAITINNTRLQHSLSEWRSQVAYLPQEIFIIDATLRENIALGVSVSEINEVRLKNAINQAHLQEMIAGLPDGLNSRLGERGVMLSGGQRQRVALARAFYFERNILVLDEATSALDHETEREIVSEIERLKGQKSMIVIAHRLSTVQHCDRIYRLKHGSIASAGTYAEVIERQL